jgi:hypothetical protein
MRGPKPHGGGMCHIHVTDREHGFNEPELLASAHSTRIDPQTRHGDRTYELD